MPLPLQRVNRLGEKPTLSVGLLKLAANVTNARKNFDARERRKRSRRQVAVVRLHNRPVAATQRIWASVIVVADVNVIQRPRRSTSVTLTIFKGALDVESGIVEKAQLGAVC